METNMFVPVWVKVLTLVLSASVVFVLAARELVVQWLRGGARLVLFRHQKASERGLTEEMKLAKQSVAKPL